MDRPSPLVTADSEPFWLAADEQRLVAQRCSSCGRFRHPPRPMCPHCSSVAFGMVELSGRGTVYSYAVLHHPRHPAFEYPVLAALVDLEEGVRLVTNVVGVEPADVRIGMDVEVEFVTTVDDHRVPVFRPVDA